MNSVFGIVLFLSRLHDAPAARAPFRDAQLHPVGAQALAAEQVDGVERHDAVRPATVRDDFTRGRQVGDVRGEVGHGRGNGARDVAGQVFLARTDVDERDLARPHAAHELFVADRLQRLALIEIEAGGVLNFGESGFGEAAKLQQEPADQRVGQAAGHVEAGLLGIDEPCAPQDLQVMRCGRDAAAGLAGEGFHRPGPLREQVEQLEPRGAGGGLADTGDLRVDGVLEGARACAAAHSYAQKYI